MSKMGQNVVRTTRRDAVCAVVQTVDRKHVPLVRPVIQNSLAAKSKDPRGVTCVRISGEVRPHLQAARQILKAMHSRMDEKSEYPERFV